MRPAIQGFLLGLGLVEVFSDSLVLGLPYVLGIALVIGAKTSVLLVLVLLLFVRLEWHSGVVRLVHMASFDTFYIRYATNPKRGDHT